MKSKKIFVTILALVLAMSMFAGCDSGSRSKSGKKSSKSESEEEEDEDDEEDDKEEKNGKEDKKDKKDKDTDDIMDPEENSIMDKEEKFEGFTDPNIKALAEEYEAMGYVVEPVTASEFGAQDYNYVEGFRMYSEEDPDTFFGWAKFDSSEDGIDFVNEVWIANCEGYIAHTYYENYLTFFIDGLYGGSVSYGGLMEYVPYEGDGRENTASPEDFDDAEVAALCKEYQDKGFKVQSESYYDNAFMAYGVDENRAHIQVLCRKFDDKDSAVAYLDEYYSSTSMTEITMTDNADGSVSVQIDDTTGSLVTFPMVGTISESGLVVLTYPE